MNKWMSKCAQMITLVGACLAMLGCMAMKPLNVDPAQLRGTLKRGDHVVVVTSSGQELQFAIESVDENGLQGGGQRVAYNHLRSISRNQVDVGRTTLIALGVVAAGALAAAGGGSSGSGY